MDEKNVVLDQNTNQQNYKNTNKNNMLEEQDLLKSPVTNLELHQKTAAKE